MCVCVCVYVFVKERERERESKIVFVKIYRIRKSSAINCIAKSIGAFAAENAHLIVVQVTQIQCDSWRQTS